MARYGISQRLAQELMRHSDPKLTAQVYTDASQLPIQAAIQQLPWQGLEIHSVTKATDGSTASQIASQNPDFSGLLQSRTDKLNHETSYTEVVDLEVVNHELAQTGAPKNGVPTGIRTPVAGMKIQCPRPD